MRTLRPVDKLGLAQVSWVFAMGVVLPANMDTVVLAMILPVIGSVSIFFLVADEEKVRVTQNTAIFYPCLLNFGIHAVYMDTLVSLYAGAKYSYPSETALSNGLIMYTVITLVLGITSSVLSKEAVLGLYEYYGKK